MVAQMHVNHGIALWPDRLGDECHPGLLRRPAPLPDVAFRARANNVFPRCLSAQAPRYHMVERQFRCRVLLAAVLASAQVACIYVPAVELDRSSRQTVIKQKTDNPRHRDVEVHSRYPVMLAGLERLSQLAQLAPALEVVI